MFSLLFALLAASPKDERIIALEAQVAQLEAQLAACQVAAAKAAPPSPTVQDPAHEAAATEALNVLQTRWREGDLEGSKRALADLRTNFAGTKALIAAERVAVEIDLVGEEAPPLQVKEWFQGRGSLEDGEVVMLVFFESWCPHCQNAMPGTEAQWERFHPQGLQVIGVTRVNKSATDDTVRSLLEEHAVQFPVAKDDGSVTSDAYKVTGIPAAAAVRDGVVIWRGHPARVTDTMIEAWLAGAP